MAAGTALVRNVPRGLLVVLALAGGIVWWWAMGRLVFAPGRAGVVEASIAAGGWGLSLLPVHTVPWARAVGPRRVRAAYRARARRQALWRRVVGDGRMSRLTTAWRRRRWGGGSGPS
ncbi:hypothetical protein H9Y04_37750 [Streptomyces sp. TRM66268-LWL]|uniref:Integral membrane protein n=1 Tax=Streptomyces polyasparticus TaxID=2767826 RepID=A0ABR7SUF3_9ACTN|nr:hypothetical protein [Streptomyces polyasparticus]MBC9718285.1 hypothetical protein [Streptomyces polyasparticus]